MDLSNDKHRQDRLSTKRKKTPLNITDFQFTIGKVTADRPRSLKSDDEISLVGSTGPEFNRRSPNRGQQQLQNSPVQRPSTKEKLSRILPHPEHETQRDLVRDFNKKTGRKIQRTENKLRKRDSDSDEDFRETVRKYASKSRGSSNSGLARSVASLTPPTRPTFEKSPVTSASGSSESLSKSETKRNDDEINRPKKQKKVTNFFTSSGDSSKSTAKKLSTLPSSSCLSSEPKIAQKSNLQKSSLRRSWEFLDWISSDEEENESPNRKSDGPGKRVSAATSSFQDLISSARKELKKKTETDSKAKKLKQGHLAAFVNELDDPDDPLPGTSFGKCKSPDQILQKSVQHSDMSIFLPKYNGGGRPSSHDSFRISSDVKENEYRMSDERGNRVSDAATSHPVTDPGQKLSPLVDPTCSDPECRPLHLGSPLKNTWNLFTSKSTLAKHESVSTKESSKLKRKAEVEKHPTNPKRNLITGWFSPKGPPTARPSLPEAPMSLENAANLMKKYRPKIEEGMKPRDSDFRAPPCPGDREYGLYHYAEFPCQCGDATAIFTKCIEFERHYRQVHPEGGYLRCPVDGCPRKFKSYTNIDTLLRHVTSIHDERRKFRCPDCPCFFGKKENMTAHHYRMHVEDRILFECDACDKTYNSKQTLMAHFRQVHDSGTSVKCNVCFYLSATPKILKSHVKQHGDLTKFSASTLTTPYIASNVADSLFPIRNDRHAIFLCVSKHRCGTAFFSFLMNMREITKEMDSEILLAEAAFDWIAENNFNRLLSDKNNFIFCGYVLLDRESLNDLYHPNPNHTEMDQIRIFKEAAIYVGSGHMMRPHEHFEPNSLYEDNRKAIALRDALGRMGVLILRAYGDGLHAPALSFEQMVIEAYGLVSLKNARVEEVHGFYAAFNPEKANVLVFGQTRKWTKFVVDSRPGNVVTWDKLKRKQLDV